MVARFFLAIHKPVIPSETWESRGNERGGLSTALPSLKKRRKQIPSFKKFMFVNRLLRKGKQQPCHRFVVHILARGNNRFNRYLGFLFYRTV